MTILDSGRLMVKQMIADANAGVVYASVPTEGSTVTAPTVTKNLTALLNNTADLTAVTFVLPAGAPDNLRVFIRAQNSIAELHVTATGETVDNWTVNMAPGDCVVYLHATPNIWSRIS